MKLSWAQLFHEKKKTKRKLCKKISINWMLNIIILEIFLYLNCYLLLIDKLLNGDDDLSKTENNLWVNFVAIEI